LGWNPEIAPPDFNGIARLGSLEIGDPEAAAPPDLSYFERTVNW
jgi:hypothetical protein